MSMNEEIDVAYNATLKKINDYIYRNEVKKTYIAAAFGVSRQTLLDYLKGNNDMPYKFILFMQQLMNSDPH